MTRLVVYSYSWVLDYSTPPQYSNTPILQYSYRPEASNLIYSPANFH